MSLIHSLHTPYEGNNLSHRGGGLSFKHLFVGPESTPNNYLFTIGRQAAFFSPRHRHNFEQFRFALRGDVTLGPGPDLLLREGQLSYHPEGVEYGPQEDGPEGVKDVLVLQFGGPSGQGYLSRGQLKEANEAVSKVGRFEKGRFYRGEEDKEGVDGFEAIWSHHNGGKKLVYPPGQYNAPVIVKPENFRWKRIAGAGYGGEVYRKNLGIFSDQETRVEMLKIEDGGVYGIAPEDATQLFFVLQGKGQANGEDWETESALRLLPGQGTTLTSESSIEMLRIVVPTLHEPGDKGNGVNGVNGTNGI